MSLRVECRAGHRGELEPKAFHFAARRIEVMLVADRWLDPQYRYFKVQAYDSTVYVLRHDELSGRWEMKWFGASR